MGENGWIVYENDWLVFMCNEIGMMVFSCVVMEGFVCLVMMEEVFMVFDYGG